MERRLVEANLSPPASFPNFFGNIPSMEAVS